MTTAILERLDLAILDGIDYPENTQTNARGTLLCQTLYMLNFVLCAGQQFCYR
jgi:hypothetical protein